MILRLPLACLLLSIACVRADGPADNLPDQVRRIPPAGLAIPEADRAELSAAADELHREIESLRGALQAKPALLELLPDVQVFQKAVRWALDYDEFFKTNETRAARALLEEGVKRAAQLRAGQAPWLAATGLVVRGYRSRIDGSVQPYGLVVPATFQPASPHAWRLDFWLHGRGETLTELDFIHGRMRLPGEFTPAHAFVLHPYGRYCNGSRFAGETDFFEALEHASRYYRFDPDRLVVRGFSLGGAACWHLATHHAWRWAAAAPGAGFSETAEFLRVFQNEKLQPAWFEQKLWHLYDATDYAGNLYHCPTVAYSGEVDRQKQAADLMARALAEERIDLVHLIGPQTGHKYHPATREEINRRIDTLAARGRDPLPRRVRFTTWTLRYNRMHWLVVDGLERHWERARVAAELAPDRPAVTIFTTNVSALTLTMSPGACPFEMTATPTVEIDGQAIVARRPASDRSWEVSFRKAAGRWQPATAPDGDGVLRKRHGLQGPIDDAFMDSFLMVRPTGQPWHEKTAAWAAAELARATNHWRRHFRGDAPVKDDAAVTEDDLTAHHLVLWGDPGSNRLLARLVDRLPLRWTPGELVADGQSRPAAGHMPVLIYPNPLNPRRYVVLNSGFTFREYDYLNNARQTPKLPDWAMVDVTQPVTSRAPGGLAAAGFFDERWQWPGNE